MDNMVEYASEIPCIMYHDIIKVSERIPKESRYMLSVDKFEEQMYYLYKNNFNTITLEELEKYLNNEIKLPKKSILITFDDGTKYSYVYAYPILKKYSLRAVNFLITGKINNKELSFNPPKEQFLNWREINEMRQVFEFACHTHNLHSRNVNRISAALSNSTNFVITDLKASLRTLYTRYFAFPFGAYDEKFIEILKSLGFTIAFSTEGGSIKPSDNRFTLSRTGINPRVSIEDFRKIVELK